MEKYVFQDVWGSMFIKSMEVIFADEKKLYKIIYTSKKEEAMCVLCDEKTSKAIMTLIRQNSNSMVFPFKQ